MKKDLIIKHKLPENLLFKIKTELIKLKLMYLLLQNLYSNAKDKQISYLIN
jgi:hypothetical protein